MTTRFMLHGEVDLATAPGIAEALEAHLEANPGDIKVDCSELTFLDSSGLAVLAATARRLNSEGWLLELVAPDGRQVDCVVGFVNRKGQDPTLAIDCGWPAQGPAQ